MTKLGMAIFTKGQKTFLNEYTKIMKVIADALNNLQGSKCPYAVVLPTLFDTKQKLDDMKTDTFVYCKPLLSATTNGFNKRFHEIMDFNNAKSLPALIATVSHPYFKLRWLNPEICNAEQTDKIKQILCYAADEISSENAVEGGSNKEKNRQENDNKG